MRRETVQRRILAFRWERLDYLSVLCRRSRQRSQPRALGEVWLGKEGPGESK